MVGGRWMGVRVDGEHAAAGFTTVAAAGGGWFWLGAASHGMVHVHVAGDRVDEMHWVTDLMLARGVVNFTGIDRRGWVWAGTDAGIVVFDGRVWRRLNTSDGVIWNDTMPNGFLADADGSVWIGTTGGLTQIKRPEALLQTAPIDLRITRVSLGGVALEPQSPPMPCGPNLFFNVHTSQLNYGKGSQSTKLHVRLRGLRDDWFEVPGHEVFLPALGPGKYTFEAVAIDLDHGQVSPVTPFSFEILPPWWRAVWFLRTVAIACLFSIVLVAVWNVRRGQERRRESERQRVEHEALVVRRDALTGLWNRAAILDTLSSEIRSCRAAGTSLAVAIIDIDHFKRINDTRGHLAGDEVLRTLGAKLRTRIRDGDALGRYGGEEFLLVMPGAVRQRPFVPLERLQGTIAEIPFTYAGITLRVTASFGVAWLSGGADTAEKLLSRADAALYNAKQAGRNCVEYAAAHTLQNRVDLYNWPTPLKFSGGPSARKKLPIVTSLYANRLVLPGGGRQGRRAAYSYPWHFYEALAPWGPWHQSPPSSRLPFFCDTLDPIRTRPPHLGMRRSNRPLESSIRSRQFSNQHI